MSDNEFAAIAFATGVVRGTRSFDVDVLGRLTGVTLKQIWTPGENQAICRKEELRRINQHRTSTLWGGLVGFTTFDEDEPAPNEELVENFLGIKHPAIDKSMKELAEKKQRRIAKDLMEDCDHGFYGYYEGSNDYRQNSRINGVIEGYGEVVIGTRGFRAMKARIVALQFHKGISDAKAALVVRNYPDVAYFNKFKSMVSEFPPDTYGSAPAPDTDPEFWTRKA